MGILNLKILSQRKVNMFLLRIFPRYNCRRKEHHKTFYRNII